MTVVKDPEPLEPRHGLIDCSPLVSFVESTKCLVYCVAIEPHLHSLCYKHFQTPTIVDQSDTDTSGPDTRAQIKLRV